MALSSTEGHQQESGAPPSASRGGEDGKTLDFLRNTTINLGMDGYYAYLEQQLQPESGKYFVSVAAWTCNSAKRRIPCKGIQQTNLGLRFTETFSRRTVLTLLQ